MADITESLERLAALKERGILTQDEFDQQKAALLNPSATAAPPSPAATPGFAPPYQPATPYAAPAAGGGAQPWMFVAGAAALLVVAALALWATGTLARLGIGSTPFGGGSSSSFASTNSSSPPMPFPGPAVAPAALPTPAPYAPAPDTSLASANPLIGDWVNDGGDTASCPSRVSFSPTMLTMTRMENGVPIVKEAAMTYELNGNTIKLTSPSDASVTTTAEVEGNHMRLEDGDCSYRRP